MRILFTLRNGQSGQQLGRRRLQEGHRQSDVELIAEHGPLLHGFFLRHCAHTLIRRRRPGRASLTEVIECAAHRQPKAVDTLFYEHSGFKSLWRMPRR
jgi:hypothetical protein